MQIGVKIRTESEWELCAVFTDQVVNAEQKSFDAAAVVRVPAGGHGQVTPHQLRQELQREALKTSLTAPIELEQLVAYWLQELRNRNSRELPIS